MQPGRSPRVLTGEDLPWRCVGCSAGMPWGHQGGWPGRWRLVWGVSPWEVRGCLLWEAGDVGSREGVWPPLDVTSEVSTPCAKDTACILVPGAHL